VFLGEGFSNEVFPLKHGPKPLPASYLSPSSLLLLGVYRGGVLGRSSFGSTETSSHQNELLIIIITPETARVSALLPPDLERERQTNRSLTRLNTCCHSFSGRVIMGSRVVVVGGGPVGLTVATLLARAGVATTVVERSTSLPNHPQVRAKLYLLRCLCLKMEGATWGSHTIFYML